MINIHVYIRVDNIKYYIIENVKRVFKQRTLLSNVKKIYYKYDKYRLPMFNLHIIFACNLAICSL